MPAFNRLTRYSLRAALILITLCGMALAWMSNYVRRVEREWVAEQEICQRLKAAGVRATGVEWVEYEWLRAVYGRDEIFTRIAHVSINGNQADLNSQEMLDDIKRLPHLRGVHYRLIVTAPNRATWKQYQEDADNASERLVKQFPDIEIRVELYDP